MNHGAWPDEVRYVAHGGPTRAWIGPGGLTLRLERRAATAPATVTGAVVQFGFGAGGSELVGGALAAAPVHVLRAGAGVGATVEDVRMVAAWPGIDVVFRDDPDGGSRGAIAYDLRVAPGADLDAARVTVAGATVVRVTDGGGLVLDVDLGGGDHVELVHRAPVAWIAGAAGDRPVSSRLRRIDQRSFGFAVDGWDGVDPLVVDPGFAWSTYVGGGASDSCRVVRAVPGIGVAVAGWAGSTDFPTTPGAYRQRGALDAFVAMLAEDGSALRWSTYLGGNGIDEIDTLDVAADGSVVVGGWTASTDFPTTAGVVQPRFGFGSSFYELGDGFLAQLSPDGSRLDWATYLGPAGDDFVKGLHVLEDGRLIVVGETNAVAFPTTPGVVQPAFGSGSLLTPDLFVARLSPGATAIEWATFFGGFAQELYGGMAVTPDGGVVVGGLTASRDFRTTAGSYQPQLRGSWDGFVAKISADGTSLAFSTLLGGDGYDQVRDLAVDGLGEIWVVGRTAATSGTAFPVTADAFQRWFGTEEDAFVARLSADGSTLRASTVLGGDGDDSCEAVVLGPTGRVFVAGFTSGIGFPVGADPAQPVFGGGIHDGFVAQLDPTLGIVRSASFIGGSAKDQVVGIDVLGDDRVVVCGTTFSGDLPVTAGAFQVAPGGGGSDGFVAVLDLGIGTTGGLVIEGAPGGGEDRVFEPRGELSLWAAVIRSTADTAIDLEAVEVTIASAGVFGEVSLYEDVDRDGRLDPGEPALAGPVLVEPGGPRARFALTHRLAPAAELALVVASTAGSSPAAGVEVVAALPADAAVVARRVSDGRRAWVSGPVPLQGPTLVHGARRVFSGDLDADGLPTCRDARWLAARLGAVSGTDGEDPDADGTVTARDVALVLARVVSRPPAFVVAPDGIVLAGGSLRIDGYGLDGAVIEGFLDRSPLRLLIRTPRALVFEVPPGVRTGPRPLRVVVDRVVVVDIDVEVR